MIDYSSPNWGTTDFFVWVGVCKEDNHNKMWGIVFAGESYYTFWSKIGSGNYGFKKANIEICTKKYIEKLRKKYVGIDPSTLNDVYPDFEGTFDSNFVMEKLKGSITEYSSR